MHFSCIWDWDGDTETKRKCICSLWNSKLMWERVSCRVSFCRILNHRYKWRRNFRSGLWSYFCFSWFWREQPEFSSKPIQNPGISISRAPRELATCRLSPVLGSQIILLSNPLPQQVLLAPAVFFIKGPKTMWLWKLNTHLSLGEVQLGGSSIVLLSGPHPAALLTQHFAQH